MHVHVYRAKGQAKFWLEPDIELAENYGLRSTAQKLMRNTAMKSEADGKITLEAEVTQIDKHGIWLLIGDKEYFLPHEKFPRFRRGYRRPDS